jgi:hypothetical protein
MENSAINKVMIIELISSPIATSFVDDFPTENLLLRQLRFSRDYD